MTVIKMTKYEENAAGIKKTEKMLEDLQESINELNDQGRVLADGIEATMTNDAEEAIRNGDDAEDDFYDAYGIYPGDYLKN